MTVFSSLSLGLLAGVSGFAIASSAAAQSVATPPVVDISKIAREPDVIVIGQRQGLLTIPGSGATIDGGELDKSRPLTINDALRQAPGVFPRDEEGLGLRPNIGIRGLNPTRSTKVLLLEDGIPLAFAPYGDNATYFHPSFKRYDRIEVLKGASQVRFGPQTIGGVINYITPKAPETFGGKALISAGSQGLFELDGTAGGPLLGGRGLLHAQSKRSDSSRDNQDLQFTDVYGKMEWDVADDQAVTLRVSRYKEDSQVSYSGLTLAEYQADPYGNPFENDRFDTERVGGALSHAWFIGDDTSLKSTLYGSHFTRDWWRQSSNSGQRPNDSSDPTCGGMANVNTTCGNEGRLRDYWVWGLESRLAHDHELFGASAKTEFGLRYHSENQQRRQWNGDTPYARTPGSGVNGGVREDNERLIDAYSAFVSTRIDLGDWIVEPGVRVEQIDYYRRNRLLAGAEGRTDLSVVVPGLGVIYRLGEKSVVYVGVHKGFAPPRVEDIINNTTGGTVDLDAEESVNWELGVRGDVAPGLYVDAAYFRMDFANQIIPQSAAGGVGATLTSAGETLHQGFELLARGSAKAAGLIATGDDLYARLSATYLMDASFEGTRFSSVSGFGAVSVTGNRLPYAPEWILSAAVGYEFGDWLQAEVEAQYTDAMFTDDLNSIPVIANGQRGLIEDVLVWNATVNLNIPGTPLGLFVTGRNLTDELYVVDRSRGILPGNKRSFQAGVTVSF
jgi:Fe(3+) dicitrate transport protein